MNAYAEESDEFECIYASYCHKLNDQVCWILWLISVWFKLKKTVLEDLGKCEKLHFFSFAIIQRDSDEKIDKVY